MYIVNVLKRIKILDNNFENDFVEFIENYLKLKLSEKQRYVISNSKYNELNRQEGKTFLAYCLLLYLSTNSNINVYKFNNPNVSDTHKSDGEDFLVQFNNSEITINFPLKQFDSDIKTRQQFNWFMHNLLRFLRNIETKKDFICTLIHDSRLYLSHKLNKLIN